VRRILIVCTANQCRSPMAAGLLARRLQQAGIAGDFQVSSAGTWAEPDRPATPFAVAALAERGVDLSGHRSREVTASAVAEAQLVLVMTEGHRAALETEFRPPAGRLALFSQLAGGTWDIADPIGQPLEAYRATADELDQLLASGWARILGEEPDDR
jgi:protein-tyrosine-phosphatase